LLELRKNLGLYANIRPANFASDSLVADSPIKPDIVRGTDLIVVRELIGGAYFGKRKEAGDEPDVDTAWDTTIYSVPEIERITRVAAQIALAVDPPLEIHSIDKANVLASSRLWRRVVTDVISKEYPQLKLDHQFVDSAAMVLVANPRKLNGVILTENLFGDMWVPFFGHKICVNADQFVSLSDQSSVIPGSLGLLPSASLAGAPPSLSNSGSKTTLGLYEPIHGSAPDIAGKGIANPVGTILSAALLLRYSLGLEKAAKIIEQAVRQVLDVPTSGGLGLRTADLGGSVSTEEIGDKILEVIKTLV
jgi:3-isopropylmalate dehydrogenase